MPGFTRRSTRRNAPRSLGAKARYPTQARQRTFLVLVPCGLAGVAEDGLFSPGQRIFAASATGPLSPLFALIPMFELRAPLQAHIAHRLVHLGDTVHAGQVLLVLEAM